MKLTHITAKNILGARQVEAPIDSAVTVFCGPNAAGKSSLYEAVRMALGQDTVRVSLKKDYGKLVTTGAKNGEVVVRFDGGQAWFMVPSGKFSPPREYTPDIGMPFALNAQRFALLDAKQRRSFLFALMGLATDAKAVKARLLQRGCHEEYVDEIAPFLLGGFDVGASEAAGRARDAKSAWHTLTGETYGSQKAETWAAAVEATALDGVPPLADLRTMLATTDKGIAEMNQQLGATRADTARLAEAEVKLPALREKVAMIDRLRRKLQADEETLADWQQRVADTRAAAKVAAGTNCACPECGAALTFAGGALQARGSDEVPDISNVGRLPEYDRALVISQNSVANTKRDLAEAETAARDLAEAEDLIAKTPASRVAADELADAIQGAQATRADIEADMRRHEQHASAAARAAQRTAEAADRHLAVQRWDAIAKALAPDGIPGEILGEALDPINDLLLGAAAESEWPAVGIDIDMSITTVPGRSGQALRPYELFSESEKWRADAMLAAAIAQLSGVRLLLLDGFDVLDVKGRGDLFFWVEGLAESGAIDTVLLFGTLKAQPSDLSPTFRTYWIADGVLTNASQETTA